MTSFLTSLVHSRQAQVSQFRDGGKIVWRQIGDEVGGCANSVSTFIFGSQTVIDSAKLEGEVFPSFKNIFVLLTSNDFLGLMIGTTFST